MKNVFSKLRMVETVIVAIVCAMMIFVVQQAWATAATAAVNTPSRTGIRMNVSVYTNTIIYAGTMVCLNSTGYAVPAANASGYVVIGRASKTVDNRDNNPSGLSSASGKQTIDVERGVFGWKSSTITDDTSIGSLCYVADDNLVTSSAGSYNTIAGVVVDYDGTYVWVDTFNIGRTAGSFTTLAASGAVALSSTLAVTGSTALNGGLTMDTSAFAVANTTGIVTMYGGATLDNYTDAAKLTITEGTVEIIGAETVSSTLGVTGLLTASGGVKYPVASTIACTNAQVLTLAYGLNCYSNAVAAGTGTNTVTLANPAAGQVSILVNEYTSVNTLGIALTGNYYGPAILLAPGESAILWGVSATKWNGIGQ